jgi:hypothetical protein
MASFDIDTFLTAQGESGTGPVRALGMAYGLPSCMLNLASDVLSLLPTPVLISMNLATAQAKAKANEITAKLFRILQLELGVITFDTETGTFQFKSDDGWLGFDLGDIGEIINLVQGLAAFGAQIYQNVNAAVDQVESIIDCVGSFGDYMAAKSPGYAADQLSAEERQIRLENKFAGAMANANAAKDFIRQAEELENRINGVLRARRDDPSLEPVFRDDAEFGLSGLNTGPRVDPGLQEEDVFRLTFGPPETTTGQYVLTQDGLYYDSQSGGLDPVFTAISGIIEPGDRWRYDYDPNLGGKGRKIDVDSLNKFADNIFDPSRIDDSIGMQDYYDQDHFLKVIKQQRDKLIFDLSSDLASFESQFGADSSIVLNQKQLIISEIANHTDKMNRRKKQIEVAVKAPQIYGGRTSPLYPPGEVPINDFSYLADYNLQVDLEKQKALIFEQAEVEGIVLPLNPKFVRSSAKAGSVGYEHLQIPTIGRGSIIYAPSSVSATNATILSLTDNIVTKGLFSIYNFLDTGLELPSSTNFQTTNCATDDMYNNAQLVGTSKKTIFASGVAIPYLGGITKNKGVGDVAAASAVGSFLRLPDTREYQDLTYSPSGFSMECWVHVPDITDAEKGWLSGGPSSLTKVLLASENVGVKEGVSSVDHTGQLRDLDLLPNDRGEQFVRGMVCGFTRDRRITQKSTEANPVGYSNLNSENNPASSLSFFIAPTISRDLSSESFVNADECTNYPDFLKMKVDLSATDFGKVDSQFVLIDITCDPINNQMRMYADGNLVATSSISTVFGIEPTQTISLPNFKKPNSFEYSISSVDGPFILKQGPLLNPFYTPWIVGGGYTDGMYNYGNFMGGDRGGVTSGLRGHVGSLKFYSRPLDSREVKKNYEAQRGFFKNIKI